MVDRTAEIATLRQKLAALAAAEADKNNVFIQERGRHNTTEADKDNAFKLFTSWRSEKIKSTPTLDDVRERVAALLRDMNNPVEVATPEIVDPEAGAPSRVGPVKL